MKKLLPILTLLLLLTGCSLIDDSYTVVQDHAAPVMTETDAVTVSNYDELKYAILDLVDTRQESGVIQAVGYDGDASTDAAAAVYDVWNNDPDGNYAIEFITADCTQILTRSDITVTITYRENVLLPGAIPYVRGQSGIRTGINSALSKQESTVTLRVSNYPEEVDLTTLVSEYCAANPLTVIEQPQVSAAVYPAEGSVRIVELTLGYVHDAETRSSMQEQANSVADSAVAYVSHCEDNTERADLLVRYLLERFIYRFETTNTPAYSLLCEGVTDSRAMAQIFAELCEQTDLNCQVVSGYRNGVAYYWNILELNGGYSHVDLCRQAEEGRTSLILYADSDMNSYSWDHAAYPACGVAASTAENPDPPAESTEPTEPTESEPTEEEPDPETPESETSDPEASETPEETPESTDTPESSESAEPSEPTDTPTDPAET